MENKRQFSQEEVTQMEKELSKMECELNEQYQEVGKCILERVEQESKKVNSLVDLIIETKQRLASAKEERRCPACMEPGDWNSVYCKRCRMKFPKANEMEEDNNGTEEEK